MASQQPHPQRVALGQRPQIDGLWHIVQRAGALATRRPLAAVRVVDGVRARANARCDVGRWRLGRETPSAASSKGSDATYSAESFCSY
eukprot:scaffold10647_cov113-Isochrysis_galbana.AAC.7